MGRMHLSHIAYPLTGQRSSLGDTHVDTACASLKKQARVTANLMAKYIPTREATLHMLFHDTDLEKLRQVRGMVETVNVNSYTLAHNTILSIDYTDALVPAIEPKALYMQLDRMKPLQEWIDAVRAVHDRFEELKAVLKWLNREATPGAIRYYFPQAMQLCPSSPIWADLQQVPSRYTTPDGIHHWLQPIRDAANTFAGMALTPSDAVAKTTGTMKLTFQACRVGLGDLHYTTDVMTYNL